MREACSSVATVGTGAVRLLPLRFRSDYPFRGLSVSGSIRVVGGVRFVTLSSSWSMSSTGLHDHFDEAHARALAPRLEGGDPDPVLRISGEHSWELLGRGQERWRSYRSRVRGAGLRGRLARS